MRNAGILLLAGAGLFLLLAVWTFAGELAPVTALWHGPRYGRSGFYTPDFTLEQLAIKTAGLSMVAAAFILAPRRERT